MNRVKETLRGLVQPLLAVFIGLIAGAVAILIVGGNVVDTYAEMWKGPSATSTSSPIRWLVPHQSSWRGLA